MVKVNRALISVFDKRGIVEFARALSEWEVEIISTGGTAKLLKDAGIHVRLVSDYTEFPEILDGRVKTVHPKIFAGLLALRDSQAHMGQLKQHSIEPIDMVVINLYPFSEVVAREGVTRQEAIENIDIGGPSMLRSAAKNYKWVVPVSDPSQYSLIIDEMKRNKGRISEETSLRLATEVFRLVTEYNHQIYQYFLSCQGSPTFFPDLLQLRLEKVMDLRYGENPHQKAAFYRQRLKGKVWGLGDIEQLAGKELSFNNILDTDCAITIAREFTEPVAVVIKHNNPCGCATAETLIDAYKKARQADPVSAFGSIVGFNKTVDEALAEEICKTFVEVVVAPDFTDGAIKIFKAKKGMRILRIKGEIFPEEELDMKKVTGGMLVQTRDRELLGEEFKVVTDRRPTEKEKKALLFAWKVCKHVKSNAIVLSSDDFTLGVGAGQMSRVDAVKIAIRKMEEQFGKGYKGTIVLASDAFFPFRDVVDVASEAGVTAIIQPGGSLRDMDSIQACNEYKIAMVFTGMRHFRH